MLCTQRTAGLLPAGEASGLRLTHHERLPPKRNSIELVKRRCVRIFSHKLQYVIRVQRGARGSERLRRQSLLPTKFRLIDGDHTLQLQSLEICWIYGR